MKENVVSIKVSRLEGDTLPEGWYNRSGEFWFPINQWSFDDLIGKVLTHIDAMNLPEQVCKANKDIVKQTLYNWYSGVQENSMTSYEGCIAPIIVHNLVSVQQ